MLYIIIGIILIVVAVNIIKLAFEFICGILLLPFVLLGYALKFLWKLVLIIWDIIWAIICFPFKLMYKKYLEFADKYVKKLLDNYEISFQNCVSSVEIYNHCYSKVFDGFFRRILFNSAMHKQKKPIEYVSNRVLYKNTVSRIYNKDNLYYYHNTEELQKISNECKNIFNRMGMATVPEYLDEIANCLEEEKIKYVDTVFSRHNLQSLFYSIIIFSKKVSEKIQLEDENGSFILYKAKQPASECTNYIKREISLD